MKNILPSEKLLLNGRSSEKRTLREICMKYSILEQNQETDIFINGESAGYEIIAKEKGTTFNSAKTEYLKIKYKPDRLKTISKAMLNAYKHVLKDIQNKEHSYKALLVEFENYKENYLERYPYTPLQEFTIQ